MKQVVVIGGGAAGLMAAVFALRAGARVTLLERNEKLGKKIYITGKGRCNLTNLAPMDSFMKNIPRNARFLYSALNFLDNAGIVAFFNDLGMPTKVERGERVYPLSEHASDVTRALESELRRLGVTMAIRARVSRILTEGGRVTGALLETGETFPADAVVIATGGLSYPSTGSTGDGYRLAQSVGHLVTPTRPALVALETEEIWPFDLSGLTLKNVRLTWKNGKKKPYGEQGEMLLTHFGISGPLVLTLSSLMTEPVEGAKLQIDLKPALTLSALDARLLRDFQQMQNKQLITVMDGLAPHNLALALLKLLDLAPARPVHSITQAERQSIAELLKGVPLTVKALRGYPEAVVTRGGVDVREVQPGTMESKICPGLFFAGEVLDVDALTGGFNLQLAFSTGALAGHSAAQQV